MPRSRKSTQVLALKRPTDSDFKYEKQGKKPKLLENTSGDGSKKQDSSRLSAKKTETVTSTKNIVSTTKESEYSITSGGTQQSSSGEKRNLSLEALFQVTDSELQNITRQGSNSPRQVVCSQNEKKNQTGNSPERKIFIQIPPVENVIDDKSNLLENKVVNILCPVSDYEKSKPDEDIQIQEVTAVPIAAQQVEIVQSHVGETTGRRRKHPQKPGRHICPYCGRGCAKPSVLQKHIRAHTGERPYPCVSCGFSFKTKSNLYKHCKSRAHALKVKSLKLVDGTGELKAEIIEFGENTEESDGSDITEGSDDEGTDISEDVGERREHAPMHVLKSVAKYLEKPKEERPKVETPQPRSHNLTTKLEKIKSVQEQLKEKLERSALARDIQKDSFTQEREINPLEKQRAHNVQNQFLRIAPKIDGASVSVNPTSTGEQNRGEILPRQINIPTSMCLPLVLPPNTDKEIPNNQMEEDVQNIVKLTVMGNNQQETLSTHIPVTTADLQNPVEVVKLPNPNTDQALSTNALRELERLSEKFRVASKAGLKISASFLTLPDQSCQVSVQVLSGLNEQTLQKIHSSPASLKHPEKQPQSLPDQRGISAEMLSQRIQELISTNAAIVSTPMSDPPRHKRLSRQNSEVGTSSSVGRDARLGVKRSGTTLQNVPSLHSSAFVADKQKQQLFVKRHTPERSKSFTLPDFRALGQHHKLSSTTTSPSTTTVLPNSSHSVKIVPDLQALGHKDPEFIKLSAVPTHVPNLQFFKEGGQNVPHTFKITVPANISDLQISKTSQEKAVAQNLNISSTFKSATEQQKDANCSKPTLDLPETDQIGLQSANAPTQKSVSDLQLTGCTVKELLGHQRNLGSYSGIGLNSDHLQTGMKITSQSGVSIPISVQSSISVPISVQSGSVIYTPFPGTKDIQMDNSSSTFSFSHTEADTTKTLTAKDLAGQEITIKIKLNKPVPETSIERTPQRKYSTEIPIVEKDSYGPYFCKVCNVSFLKEQTLELHKNYYCKKSEINSTKPNIFQTSGTLQQRIDRAKIAKLFSFEDNLQSDDSRKCTNIVISKEQKFSSHETKNQDQYDNNTNVIHTSQGIVYHITDVGNHSCDSQEPTIFPRKKGRPKGSRNKPKDQTEEQSSPPSTPQQLIPVQIFGQVKSDIPETGISSLSKEQMPVVMNICNITNSHVLQLLPQANIVTSSFQSSVGSSALSLGIKKTMSMVDSVPETPNPMKMAGMDPKMKLKGKLIMKKLKGKLMSRSLSLDRLPSDGMFHINQTSKEDTILHGEIGEPPIAKVPKISEPVSKISFKKLTRADSEPVIKMSAAAAGKTFPEIQKKINLSLTSEQKKEIYQQCLESLFIPVVKEEPIFQLAQVNSKLVYQQCVGNYENQIQILAQPDNMTKSENEMFSSSSLQRPPTISRRGSLEIPQTTSKLKAALLGHSIMELNKDQSEVEKTLKMQAEELVSPVKANLNLPIILYGHSYPSLRTSSQTTFCSVKRPQPMYVQQGSNKKVSMYSNWKAAVRNPNPIGLTSRMLLELYNSHYTSNPVYRSSDTALPKGGILTHSSYWTYKQNQKNVCPLKWVIKKDILKEKPLKYVVLKSNTDMSAGKNSDVGLVTPVGKNTKQNMPSSIQGGYKTTEEYVYVRGRGRGKYVCEKCGIRCKKPSMLKKHIRTHTNLRPYHCKHCKFSFKTKGNLTKHMKSKAHHKKCMELGIFPIPVDISEDQIDNDALAIQSQLSDQARIIDKQKQGAADVDEEDTESGEDDDGDEEEEDDGNEVLEEICPGSVGAEVVVDSSASESVLTVTDVEPGLIALEPVMCSTIQSHNQSIDKERSIEVKETLTVASDDVVDNSKDAVLVAMQTSSHNAIPGSKKADPTRLGTVYGFDTKEDVKDGNSGRIEVVAQSLLSLKSTENDSTDRNKLTDSRLGHLIGALRMRTKAITEEKEREDTVSEKSSSFPTSGIILKETAESDDKVITIKYDKELTSSEVSSPQNTHILEENNKSSSLKSSDTVKLYTSSQQGLIVTVPLGGYMPPMYHSAIEKSSVPKTQLSPSLPFQFSHPFNCEPAVSDISIHALHTVQRHLDFLDTSRSSDNISQNESDQVSKKCSSDPQIQNVMNISTNQMSTSSHSQTDIPFSTIVVENIPTHESLISSELKKSDIEEQVENNPSVVIVGTKFVCDICQKSFQEQQQMILHRHIHSIEKPFKCEICSSAFKSQTLYQKHIQTTSHILQEKGCSNLLMPTMENPRPFKCTDCGVAFRMKGHMAKHLRSKLHVMRWEVLGKLPHGTYIKYENVIAGLDATDPDTCLKQLQQLVKNDDNLIKFQQLDLKIGTENEEDESGEPDSISPVNEQFQAHKRAAYERHDLASNDRVTVEIKQEPIDFGDIGKVNATGETFEDNSNSDPILPDIMQVGPHLCGICRRGFINLDHLKSHLITHAELRPYVCEYCDAGFTNAQSLRTHLQTHPQERPYTCGFCGETFARSENLKIHVQVHTKSQSFHTDTTYNHNKATWSKSHSKDTVTLTTDSENILYKDTQSDLHTDEIVLDQEIIDPSCQNVQVKEQNEGCLTTDYTSNQSIEESNIDYTIVTVPSEKISNPVSISSEKSDVCDKHQESEILSHEESKLSSSDYQNLTIESVAVNVRLVEVDNFSQNNEISHLPIIHTIQDMKECEAIHNKMSHIAENDSLITFISDGLCSEVDSNVLLSDHCATSAKSCYFEGSPSSSTKSDIKPHKVCKSTPLSFVDKPTMNLLNVDHSPLVPVTLNTDLGKHNLISVLDTACSTVDNKSEDQNNTFITSANSNPFKTGKGQYSSVTCEQKDIEKIESNLMVTIEENLSIKSYINQLDEKMHTGSDSNEVEIGSNSNNVKNMTAVSDISEAEIDSHNKVKNICGTSDAITGNKHSDEVFNEQSYDGENIKFFNENCVCSSQNVEDIFTIGTKTTSTEQNDQTNDEYRRHFLDDNKNVNDNKIEESIISSKSCETENECVTLNESEVNTEVVVEGEKTTYDNLVSHITEQVDISNNDHTIGVDIITNISEHVSLGYNIGNSEQMDTSISDQDSVGYNNISNTDQIYRDNVASSNSH